MRLSIALVALVALALLWTNTTVTAQETAADYPASAFAGLNGYIDAEISPDGSQLAFLFPLEGRLNLVVHTFATEANTVIPPLEGLNFNWMTWANNETLVFSMGMSAVRKGYIMVDTEETRLIGLNVKTRKVTPLIKPAEVVGRTGSRAAKEYYGEPQLQDNVISWLPDDPDHILVSVDEDFDARYEVRKVNVNSGRYSTYRKGIEGIQDWIVDQDNEVRLGYGYRKGANYVVFRDAEGDWLPMGKIDWYQNGWRPFAFTEDSHVILVTGTGENGTRELRKLNTQTGEFVETVFENPDYDVLSVVHLPPSTGYVGVNYSDPATSVKFFDPEVSKLHASINKALPGYRNKIQSMSADRRKVVIRSSNSREPGVIFIWDRDAGSLEPFGYYNEVLDPELLADKQEVSYQSYDGTVIPAYLSVPPNVDAKNLPSIVLPHGGPASRDDKSYWFVTQFLVSRGYAVLQPNFRGSTGYGAAFRNAGRGQWGGLMQDDVDAGAAWLVEQGIANPDRMCIVGWSYGGYSAAMGLVKSPQLYQCGIGINGVYNLPQLVADSNEYVGGSVWSRHIGLDGESTRSVSPQHQVEKIEAPFLIIHAEDDHRVRLDQAQTFYKALQRDDKPSRLVTVEHGGHSMVTAEARLLILKELETFLEEQIGAP